MKENISVEQTRYRDIDIYKLIDTGCIGGDGSSNKSKMINFDI